MPRRLTGVGVGPGDPELVTVKAVRVLREADVVFAPVLAGPTGSELPTPVGRAEAVIREHVDPSRIRRLEFALNDLDGVTERRVTVWDAAAAVVVDAFAAGATTIAFGTIGDPNIYSTFSYLAQTVRLLLPDVDVATVPGITAMQDLAARRSAAYGGGSGLVEGDQSLVLLPLTAGGARLREALAGHDAVVGYKLGSVTGPSPAEVVALLARTGRLGEAVFGSRLGLAGEEVASAAELAGRSDVPYLSTLVVPAKRSARGGALGTGSASARAASACAAAADPHPARARGAR